MARSDLQLLAPARRVRGQVSARAEQGDLLQLRRIRMGPSLSIKGNRRSKNGGIIETQRAEHSYRKDGRANVPADRRNAVQTRPRMYLL